MATKSIGARFPKARIRGRALVSIFFAAVLCLDAAPGSESDQNLISLGLPAIADPNPGKPDFFFQIGDTLSVLFDGYLEYGSAPPWTAPCDGRINPGPEQLPVAPTLPERCRFASLHIFSRRGVIPVPTPLRFIIDTVNQCEPMLRFSIRHAPVREPLFISTWKGKGPFLAPKPIKLKPEGLIRPPEAKSYSVESYAYPGDMSLTLSVVHYRHVLPPMDDGYEALPEREETAGRLYLNQGDQSFFLNWNHDFGKSDLAGFMDVNGDGELDIIVGKPVEMILERYRDGYRLWWWADYPTHGC